MARTVYITAVVGTRLDAVQTRVTVLVCQDLPDDIVGDVRQFLIFAIACLIPVCFLFISYFYLPISFSFT